MPLAKIVCSRRPEKPELLLGQVSRLLAERLNKPEHYVMTCLDAPALMTFSGSNEPCAYVEIKNIGKFTSAQTSELSREVCALLSEWLPATTGTVIFADGGASTQLL